MFVDNTTKALFPKIIVKGYKNVAHRCRTTLSTHNKATIGQSLMRPQGALSVIIGRQQGT